MVALLDLPPGLRVHTSHKKNGQVAQLRHLLKHLSSPACMSGPSALCVHVIEVPETINGRQGIKIAASDTWTAELAKTHRPD